MVQRKWPEERIPVDLEPIPGFNLRAQVVGQGGAYVKHIAQATRCRVQIKGRGSGFTEHSTGRESDEPMFLHVACVLNQFYVHIDVILMLLFSGPDPKEVQNAKELCEDLLKNVKEQYEKFKEQPPPQHGYGGGGGGYGHRDRHHYGGGYGGGGGGGGGGGYGNHHSPAATSAMSPAAQAPPGTSASPAGQADYSAQYAQYYGGSDPYAAYGGYQNYVAYYQYYQQQAAQQQQQQQSAAPPPPPPANEAPPPPPPPGAAPPPPPPPPGGNSSYNAVSYIFSSSIRCTPANNFLGSTPTRHVDCS